LLPLDDCLYALQPSIPHLSRSALHRCLQRHGISRLPEIEGDKPKRQRFKRYPIGFFHVDIAEVQTAEGKLYLFVGIDRTSKFAFSLIGVDGAGEHWMRLPLPGDGSTDVAEVSEAQRSQGHLPEGLRLAIAGAVAPGTTLLVTRASLRSSGVGAKLAVITSGDR
jgi:hypothetical protein